MLTHRTRTINDGDGPPFDFFEVDLRVYTPRTIYKVLVGIQTKAIRLNTHNAADHFIRSFRLRNAPPRQRETKPALPVLDDAREI